MGSEFEHICRVILHDNAARRQALVRHVTVIYSAKKDPTAFASTPHLVQHANKIQGAFIRAVVTAITME